MKTISYSLFIIIVMMTLCFSCKKDKKDTTPPVITLKGTNPLTTAADTTYIDPGATAYDETDGDITSKIVITSNVNTADTGYYQVKYDVSDKAGNTALQKVRNVHVIYM